MMHEVTLLLNIAVALVAAFIGGVLAHRIGLPTIVGYLLAGIVIGPFTPGFVGDVDTISQLAELGVIFLMFGVGLHFSLKELWRVRSIAIPGALGQMAMATLLGYGISHFWGWGPAAGIVLGLAISIASTVVLLRGLMDHGLLNTQHGQVAVGWLVLEDLATVIHSELEGGPEIFRYTDAVRHDHYDLHINTEAEHRLLHDLVDAASSIEIRWFRIPHGHSFVGQTLAEANLRVRTGASVVAILREGELMANPKSMTKFQAGDRLGLIGASQEIEQVKNLLLVKEPSPLE
jgi:hypothetical protein